MNGKILIDYYDKICGTPTDLGYFEMVIMDYDGKYILEYYKQDEGMKEPNLTKFLVDKNLIDEVYNVIKKNKMDYWNSLPRDKVSPICGKYYVCKFLNYNELIRVSSDKMPEDGDKAFILIKKILLNSINENNRIK